jgi:hypothetical protein
VPRIRLIADDGWTALEERVCAADFETDHFRTQLAQRLAWAAMDAEGRPAPRALRATTKAEDDQAVAAA